MVKSVEDAVMKGRCYVNDEEGEWHLQGSKVEFTGVLGWNYVTFLTVAIWGMLSINGWPG